MALKTTYINTYGHLYVIDRIIEVTPEALEDLENKQWTGDEDPPKTIKIVRVDDKSVVLTRNEATKMYRSWKAKYGPTEETVLYEEKPQVGLGDVVENITEATGIKKVVEWVAGEDCGCKERKEKLNKIKLNIKWPVLRCFTEELYQEWTQFRKRPNKFKVTHEEQLLIIKVTERLFARSFKPCRHCGKQVEIRIKEIDAVYDNYTNTQK